MKILLTGGDGMLGTVLRKYWKGMHEIINLDKRSRNDLLNCDLNYDVDVVPHLAASSGRKVSKTPQ